MIHSIRHDNIVTVLETFPFEGSFYVVLERMANFPCADRRISPYFIPASRSGPRYWDGYRISGGHEVRRHMLTTVVA